MPWCGYNYEDAIIISEKLIREDYYTSIYLEEFELTARDTKLGKEEITKDIPNVSEEALNESWRRWNHPYRRSSEAWRYSRRKDHS